MSNFLYVDCSNVFIEGRHVSAVRRGLARDINEAQNRNICDPLWRLDFARLYALTGGDDVGTAVIYAGRTENQDLWNKAYQIGFDVMLLERTVTGAEKAVDTTIVADIVADSYEEMRAGRDEVTLVSGDRDLLPAVEHLRDKHIKVTVAFWDHAARDLRAAANEFVSLNRFLDHLELIPARPAGLRALRA